MTSLEQYQPCEPVTTRTVLTHIPEFYRTNVRYYCEAHGLLNIGSRAQEAVGEALSNFTHAAFVLDEVRYESVEVFIQILKHPEIADMVATVPVRELASVPELRVSGYKAKQLGNPLRRTIDEAYEPDGPEDPVGYVATYQGIQIPYRSPEHYALIERAIRAKVVQNPWVRSALVGKNFNERRQITHVLMDTEGRPKEERPTTSLPAEVFVTILMRMRHEEQMAHLTQLAAQGDITYHLNRFYLNEVHKADFRNILRLSYKAEAIKWMRSLTPRGMRYGSADEATRLRMVRNFSARSGIIDLDALAREAGLIK